ncbi:MAG TPA: branched-chain amino acid transaminase [Rhodanobacteraceae bacterium]
MADQKYPEWVWHNGKLVPWQDATVHVMSHSLQYGSAVFEGIRCYKTPKGGAIFRLAAHMKRFYNSARIYDMPMPFPVEVTTAACHEILKKNGFDQAYIRPCAYRGLGGFGISADCPVGITIAGWPMGPYLGAGALTKGITACVSSWQRFAPNTIPSGAKAAGNYLSGQLIAREARKRGFGEGIALASTGLISEGAGENVFLVMDGALHTAPVSASLLNGITRDSIITLARANGISVVERELPREYLYLADEIFMCGTAAEVTPIREIDSKQVGAGEAGPITRKLQDLFFGLFDGRTKDEWGWLETL